MLIFNHRKLQHRENVSVDNLAVALGREQSCQQMPALPKRVSCLCSKLRSTSLTMTVAWK